ncbi:hypothetical protein A9Q81_10135 [Gammaproteobacteria bacterium 42_54_T18]|nr:hypothetical protein A9Q81_10135 [Gammaproteobacteria bacterium 42_54_T18]
MMVFRLVVTVVLSVVMFLTSGVAVGSSSVLDSGKTSKEIAEEILRGAKKTIFFGSTKKVERVK